MLPLRPEPSALTPLERIVAGLVLLLIAARFVALETSPPGFFVDEAALAAHVTCLGAHGRDAHGQAWPLISPALGGGYATPVLLYSGAALSAVARPDIGTLRLIPAVFSALTILAVMALGRLWGGTRLALWSGLAAAVSPWAFQFSRIFWDPPLAPCFLMWALYFWFRPARQGILTAGLCGLWASLAVYSYPPMRVQLPLVLVAAVLARFDASRALVAGSTAVALSLPLILKTLTGEIQGRFRYLSIFDDGYVAEFGDPTLLLKLRLVLQKFLVHFDPGFLLGTGDGNLRHSTRQAGEWSTLDLAGVAALALVLLAMPSRRWRRNVGGASIATPVLLCCWGYACGILPAAMTRGLSPHALRAIGAWPFLSLLVGFGVTGLLAGLGDAVLFRVRLTTLARAALVALTVQFSVPFLIDYARRYPERAQHHFDVAVVQTLKDPGAPRPDGYPALAARYFDLVYRGLDRCP